jgi:Glycosyl hydrolases family 38 N-terminal domain/Alpha mannosidase middle domain
VPRPTVCLVPHTHWDREWYLPFQRFRLRLVELIDRVLDTMERDERFVFTLDGQLATVDDYLEVRPEAEPRIAELVRAGRLAIGPWQILMDEFLVSGETIVRNLQAGLRRGEELGGAMRIGYLPDMFGHAAQLPQILRRAGIDRAVVWRGVPAAIAAHAFEWASPDGSSVRAEYLAGSYGNAAYMLDVPGALAEKARLLHETLAPFFGDDPRLAMLGTDHMVPTPELPRLVADANDGDGAVRIALATLDGYLAEANGDRLTRWQGELRSAARANLLPNVTSARIDLKAACARAERTLERYAEPLLALHDGEWPERLLELAWRRVIENSAHDSICGCSADEVSRQVLVRFDEARQIAEELTASAARAIATRVVRGSTAVVNPSPAPRADVVELDLPIPVEWPAVALELPDGTRLATQEVARAEPLLLEHELPGRNLPEFLERRLHGRELFGRALNGLTVEERRVVFDVAPEPDPEWLDVDDLKAELELAAREAADEIWTVQIRARPRRILLARVPAPALAAISVRPVEGEVPLEDRVAVGERTLANGFLELVVEPAGTLRIGGVSGIGRLVDGGDQGDSYNYAPPVDDVLVDEPVSVEVTCPAAGPLVGRLAVTRTYRWGETLVPIEMRVELRAGEPFVRVRVSLDNAADDHRLRFHVPLPSTTDRSAAEGQFAVVERGLEVEGGHGEEPLPTFPARGFVDAGGIAVLLEHVLEYELLDGRDLALTVLRSIGLISRNRNRFREEPAGPELEIPDAQCHGPWSVAFALYPHPGAWHEASVLAWMEAYQHPFLAAPGSAPVPEELPRGLEIDGDGVVLSCLRRRGDRLELRLVCEHREPRPVRVSGDLVEAWEADLLGTPRKGLELEGGVLALELEPWEVRTLQLRQAGQTPSLSP